MKIKLITLGFAAAAILPACSTYQDARAPYDEHHKVRVAETIERMEIYIRPEGMNLSARDRAALGNFINGFAQNSRGSGLYLNVPSNMAGSPSLGQTQGEIQNMMMGAGLSGVSFQSGQYQAAPGAPAPIVLSYRRLAVMPIDCAVNSDLARTYNNQAYPNFGCAGQSNFAVMVNDPTQILDGYGSTPANTERRVNGVNAYVQGESPASAIPTGQQVSSSE